MPARLFIDTNVLVYAYDLSNPQKQQQAIKVLDLIAKSNAGAISTQVLMEFVNATTRKLLLPLSPADVYSQVEQLLRIWSVIDISAAIVLEAVRGVRDHRFSIWDAQIWATARLSGIPVVLSEDFNPGANIQGVRFANPFAPGFDVAILIGQSQA
jgi:predicted nucleic acid-binding protein